MTDVACRDRHDVAGTADKACLRREDAIGVERLRIGGRFARAADDRPKLRRAEPSVVGRDEQAEAVSKIVKRREFDERPRRFNSRRTS